MAREEILGERVRMAREARHLSQTDLAEMIESHQRVISFIENGRSDPKLSTLRKLAKALDVSLEWLMIPQMPDAALFAAHEPRESYATEHKKTKPRRRKSANPKPPTGSP